MKTEELTMKPSTLSVFATALGAAISPVGAAETPTAPLVWQVSYDDAGRIASATDPDGQVTRWSRELDAQQRVRRVKQERPDDSIVTVEFDASGRRTLMSDALGRTSYCWDGERLRSVIRTGDPSVTYERDAQGSLTGIEVAGQRVHYFRDFLGRLEHIQTSVGDITFRYLSSQGVVERTLPNGVLTRWTHGPDGRLKDLLHANKARHILARFTYEYRPDGLIAAVEEWSPQGPRTLRYDYDVMGQLVAVHDSRTGRRLEFTFDLVGNRLERRTSDNLSARSVCDPLGRLSRHGEQPCQHDAAGNLTRYGTPTGRRTLEFDAANLIKSATLDNVRTDYVHDGDGALVTRVSGGHTTKFVNDPLDTVWCPLLATDDAKQTTFYIWNGDFALAALSGNEAKFFLEDHLGSVRLIVDGSGSVLERCDYDAHGVPLSQMKGEILRPGFAGMFYDGAAKLYLTRARGYEPELGRFLQVEPRRRLPLGSIKDISLYAYCGNDPVNLVDRDGLTPDYFDSWQRNSVSVLRDANHQAIQTLQQKVQATFSEPVNVLVGGVNMRADDTMTAAKQFLGPSAVGIPVDHNGLFNHNWGFFPDAIWAAMDQTAGGHITRTEERLWSQLTQTPNIGTLEIYSHGAITTGNLSERIDHALANGTMRIGQVIFYGVHPDSHLTAVLEKHGIPQSVRAHINDPVPWVTAPNAVVAHELGIKIPVLDWAVGGAVKLAGLAENYLFNQTSYHDLNYLHQLPAVKISSESQRHIAGYFPLRPSNVGGVWLGGAKDALGDLGMLKGIALGDNGQLILLADERADIALPPLRLSGVVTVFRSVYEHGESPFVSIDPDPQNPHGPTMLIRHGIGTKERYAGWILFESDRIMKGYSLLHDTMTGATIQSKVPGFAALADEIAHGPGPSGEDSVWERFWIVPSVTRRSSTSGELTLLDVPLEVKTQRMVMRDGKLVPAPDDTPSERATTFAKWFTEHYDDIARESFSSPPWLKGTNQLVSSLAELRRIALIAALAERLRDQQVPMPAWMKDYPVEAVSFGPTTPALTVEWTNTTARRISTRRIYGGVSLSPSDDRVRTLPPTRAADELLIATRKAIAAAPPLTPVSIVSGGQRLQAVALPGESTRAVGACRWREVDLTVSLPDGDTLRIEREAHSFFQPRDVFGAGWTMDLPRLEQVRRPIRRHGDAVTFKTAFQLQSPLNTWSASFEEQREMPELGGKLLAPSHPGEAIALGRTTDARLGGSTDTVFCRDGSRLHFGTNGELAATDKAGALTKYVRDSQGRLERIEAWRGRQQRADIQLAYDVQGRLAEARGSDGSQVSYRYYEDGRLAEARHAEGTSRYNYANGLLARVERDGRLVREFICDSRGCLQYEKREDGSEWSFVSTAMPSGVKIAAQARNQSKIAEEAEFDSALRPTRRTLTDGTLLSWAYAEGQAATATIRQADGTESKLIRSADGRSAIWQTASGKMTSATFDTNGRLTSLNDGERSLLHQQWSGDGRLQLLMTESVGLHPDYREDGSISRVLLTPPVDGPKFSKWLECQLDESGRVSTVSDYTGDQIKLERDSNGYITRVSSPRGEVRCQLDRTGATETIESSWGWKQTRRLDLDGQSYRTVIRNGQHEATVEYEAGTFSRLIGFDGSRTTIGYAQNRNGGELVEKVETPSGLTVHCQYDGQSRLLSVRCGPSWKVEFVYDRAGRLIATKYQPLG